MEDKPTTQILVFNGGLIQRYNKFVSTRYKPSDMPDNTVYYHPTPINRIEVAFHQTLKALGCTKLSETSYISSKPVDESDLFQLMLQKQPARPNTKEVIGYPGSLQESPVAAYDPIVIDFELPDILDPLQ